MQETIQIGKHVIGEKYPCFIVAEIAQAHDGSLGTAHAYIDLAANAGVDAVKFQTHIAAEESSQEEPWRIQFSQQDKKRYDYWKRMEFSEEQWLGLKNHAEEKGLVFLSSPFSVAAVDLLERIGVVAWKIASGEVSNILLLERIISTGKPIILSTGMSSYLETQTAIELIKEHGNPFCVLQCTSKYPSQPEDIGLNLIHQYRAMFKCPVGLSDHSGAIYPSLSAVTLGANLIEVHTVFSRECFGPDVTSSLTPVELKELVDGIRFTEKMVWNPIVKDERVVEMETTKTIFGKSLAYAADFPKGHRIGRADLIALKPGTGIRISDIEMIVGRVLLEDVFAKQFVKNENLGE